MAELEKERRLEIRRKLYSNSFIKDWSYSGDGSLFCLEIVNGSHISEFSSENLNSTFEPSFQLNIDVNHHNFIDSEYSYQNRTTLLLTVANALLSISINFKNLDEYKEYLYKLSPRNMFFTGSIGILGLE
jgi:hypothetical protein